LTLDATGGGARAASAPRLAPPYHVIRNFLDAEAVAALLEFALANEAQYIPSTVYEQGHMPSVRVSSVLPDFGRFDELLRTTVRSQIPTLTTTLRVSPFEESRIEIELAAHNDGAFYKPHIDTFTGPKTDLTAVRVISGVYYFHREPKAYTGGALRLYDFQRDESEPHFVDFEPEQNMFLAFPSWARHEVRKVSCPTRRFEDSRFAVNCWVHAKLAPRAP
jgi:Rps23 Pro-64 3,4-dihydroxylase Tpa1-like proline 4-hydroxylase